MMQPEYDNRAGKEKEDEFGFYNRNVYPARNGCMSGSGIYIKKWCPADNKWIPTILVILGAVLGCVAGGEISLGNIVAGAVTGLASTGLHQVFKQLVVGEKEAAEQND